MSTTQVAAQLFQLQQVDLELDRLRAELQMITNNLQGNLAQRQRQRDYQLAQQRLQAGLQQQKDAEWVLDDLIQRLAEQEKRLYSGTSFGSKELQSLQQETQRLRDQQGRQEEVVLTLLDTADTLQMQVQHKQAALQEAETAWEKESATFTARRDQVEAHQQALQREREQALASLPAELVTRYTTLRRTKQGRAISKVEQNSCQWCRVILTPSELQHVRVSSELQTCMNCGRILYYDR
jgi:hypothetical protein